MQRNLSLMVVLLALASSACVTSEQSFVPPGRAVFDPALVGTWHNLDGTERAVVTQASPTSYRIVYTEDSGKQLRFTGLLAALGARRVLDLENREMPEPGTETGGAHQVLVLDGLVPRVSVAALERDTLDAYLARNPGAIGVRRTKDETVFTARSAALLAFLDGYLKQPGVLGDSSIWVRRSP